MKFNISDNDNNINKNNDNSIIEKKNIKKKENNHIEEELKVEKLYGFNYSYLITGKILVIGDSDSGKTWILDTYLSRPSSNFSTSGMNKDIFYIEVNNTIIRIISIDLPGGEKFFPIAQRNSENQDLIIFIYSISNYNSFKILKDRIKIVKQECKNETNFILVGSKADLEESREVSYEDGQGLADKENFDLFIEVSAIRNFNIDQLFFEAAKILYRKNNS